MRFFYIVGVVLGAIALLNFIHIVVEFSMRDQVYACSDIGRYVPQEVKNKCRKYK